MIAGVVVLHIWALHVAGQNNPLGIDVKSKEDTVAVPPLLHGQGRVRRRCVFLILFAWVVFFLPNYLGHPDNYIPANPLKTPAHIVPEWYFLPFYAILRAIPDKLLGVIALFARDRGAVLPALARHVAGPLGGLPADLPPVLLDLRRWSASASAISARSRPEGGYVIASRILTAYYFLHFLVILPLLGLIERPKPLPASITEAVLGKRGHAPAPAAGGAT